MSTTDKTKLDGIAEGANKYSHPTYTSKTSGLYKITVDGTGHVSAATAVAKSDITALGIPAQDTVYSHPRPSSGGAMNASSKLYKFSTDEYGHISAVTEAAKSDITALGIPAQDTTYSIATSTTAGLVKSSTTGTTADELVVTAEAATVKAVSLANLALNVVELSVSPAPAE